MNRIKQRMAPVFGWMKRYRAPLGMAVLVSALVFLTWYLVAHPMVVKRLLETNPLVLLALFMLYTAFVVAIFFINFFTVRICRKQLGVKDGIFLTIYSTVINFFGPLQSGPGVRAAYLKTHIGLRIRDYTMATLFYYFAYAAINMSLLFVSSWWWLTVLGFLASIVGIVLGVRYLHFRDRAWDVMAIYIVALVQTLILTAIYDTELHAIGATVSYVNALVYSASANLSLFVSLTPGGIGVREGFILFAQNLHHIPLSAVISAGVLDRAFYVIFLVLLFAIGSALHVRSAITARRGQAASSPE